MAHPPLQSGRRLLEPPARSEAGDSDRGEGRLGARRAIGRIELRLRHLAQLFHSFDPSPFRERELDAQAAEFIVDWAREFPRRMELELLVHLEEQRPEPAEDLSSVVSEAVANHFAYRADSKRREHRALMARGRSSLGLGLLFFGAAIGVANALAAKGEGRPLLELTRETVLIGGWVALWRPLEIFVYDSWDVRRQEREFRRLARMRVRVECPRG